MSFVIRESQVHGRGAFALTGITRGTRIGEYSGRRCRRDAPPAADAEALDDAETQDEHPATYRFVVDETWLIDGRFGGNDTRFINHGCDPNCKAVVEEGRIFIEAVRDIAAGDELLLDYRLRTRGPLPEELRGRFACYCGAPNCRGSLIAGS